MACLPIGCRFKPTKTQLIGYFLKTKLSDQPLPPYYPQFLDFDVYTDHPFNILVSTKEVRGVRDEEDGGIEGYFFTRLKKTAPKGKRITRCIEGHGTWLEKSKAKKVYDETMKVIGVERYFKFKPVAAGSNNMMAQNDEEWKMHEYSLPGYNDIVLCHITKKKDSSEDDVDDTNTSSKRSRNYAINDYHEASASKHGRVECGSLDDVYQASDHYVEHPQNVMHQGINDHGLENTNSEALAAETLSMISFDVDEDDTHHNDQQLAPVQGSYDEQGITATELLYYNSLECSNDIMQVPQQEYQFHDIMQVPQQEYQFHDIMQVPQQDYQFPDEQALYLASGAQDKTTCFDYSSTGYNFTDTIHLDRFQVQVDNADFSCLIV